MSLPSQTEVLIVGAGPVGMTCAISLAALGVKATLVDACAARPYGCRSAAVHARTLEVLNSVGLARPLINLGLQCSGVTFRGGRNKLIEFNVAQLHEETRFPMVVFIPQDKVERILRERLAYERIDVHREKTVIGLKEAPSGQGIDVTFDNGAIVRARYVIGADGVRSTIRGLVGIDFEDPHTGAPYDGVVGPTIQIALADVYLKEPLEAPIPRNTFSAHIDRTLLLLPLRSEDDTKLPKNTSMWRMAMGFTSGGPALPQNPPREYLQQMLDERNPYKEKITIDSVATSSRYRVRSAIASTYFKKLGNGNVLLVGDAAHSHSPVGGQGMNLGVCDAFDLAHAIHTHIYREKNERTKQDADAPLSYYSVSRRSVAVKVITFTKRLNAFMNARAGWRRLVRNIILRFVSLLPFMGKFVARRFSGIIYRAISDW